MPPAAAYQRLTGSGGFADSWLAQGPPRGRVSPSAWARLSTTRRARFSRRIDLVLVRGLPADRLAASRGEVTGDEPADRDPGTGLWPSDHAGVVVQLPLGSG